VISWTILPVQICSRDIVKFYKFCKTSSYHNQPCNWYIFLPYLWRSELSYCAERHISNFQQNIYPTITSCISDINLCDNHYTDKLNQFQNCRCHRGDLLNYLETIVYICKYIILMSIIAVTFAVFLWFMITFYANFEWALLAFECP